MKNWKSIIPYIAPYLIFILIGSASKLFGDHAYLIYPVKTIVTFILLLYWWKIYKEIKFSFSPIACITGIIVFFAWIGLTEHMPFKMFHPPDTGYNPIRNTPAATAFLIFFRLGGAVLVVPLFEELFMRSFVIRLLINPDNFDSVPVGKFTMFSLTGSVILFTLGHNLWEWPAATVTGIIYTMLLYRRGQLFDCVLAHAVTNLCLGIYVLTTGKFGYW